MDRAESKNFSVTLERDAPTEMWDSSLPGVGVLNTV